MLKLTTLRSHDQYNTTIYGLDDRYRGVFGRRDVLFVSEQDLAAQNLAHGDVVEVASAIPGQEHRRIRLTAIAHDIASGSIGAYYPEANNLCPLDLPGPAERHAVVQVPAGAPAEGRIVIRSYGRERDLHVKAAAPSQGASSKERIAGKSAERFARRLSSALAKTAADPVGRSPASKQAN